MKLTKHDIVYILIPLTLYSLLFMFKTNKSLEFNKLKESALLFLMVVIYNIHPMLSCCLYLLYLLNKHLDL